MKKTLQEKKQDMIVQYMPYAENQARLFVAKYKIDYMLDDFISVAYIGLCKAARKYKKTKMKIAFGQFMPIYVLGSMMDEFRQMDVLTRVERKNRIEGKEIEDIFIVSIDDLVYSVTGKESDYTLISDVLSINELSIDNMLDKKTAIEKLVKETNNLPPRERLVFSLYCINRYTTYDDISAILGISVSRVCQLLHQAKETLKEKIKWGE